jgi:hypothetical protein
MLELNLNIPIKQYKQQKKVPLQSWGHWQYRLFFSAVRFLKILLVFLLNGKTVIMMASHFEVRGLSNGPGSVEVLAHQRPQLRVPRIKA